MAISLSFEERQNLSWRLQNCQMEIRTVIKDIPLIVESMRVILSQQYMDLLETRFSEHMLRMEELLHTFDLCTEVVEHLPLLPLPPAKPEDFIEWK